MVCALVCAGLPHGFMVYTWGVLKLGILFLFWPAWVVCGGVPNLVLVTIDTLRADRLGCYGYSKIATPNLDSLARRGVLFAKAITHTPLTAPAHASIFTGLYPPSHKVRDTGGFVLGT